MATLKLLWKCLEDDAVFSYYREQIARNWALLPSTGQQLYSAKSEILPVINPTIPLDEECTYDELELSVFSLLRGLNMPILDSSVSHIVIGFCPTMKSHPLIFKNVYHLHKNTNVLQDLHNPSQVADILLAYFARIDFRYDGTSLSHIKELPLFQTIIGKYSELAGKTTYLWPANFCHAGYPQWAEKQNV